MKYYNHIKIGDTYYQVNRISVGDCATFGANGNVLAVAVERTSVNYYMCYAILKGGVISQIERNHKNALKFIQDIYKNNTRV